MGGNGRVDGGKEDEGGGPEEREKEKIASSRNLGSKTVRFCATAVHGTLGYRAERVRDG